jgi:hypothetical protein
MHEAMHYFTHADKSIFSLLKQLILKTGTVAREFVLGKRKKYFSPLNFYFLVATIFVLTITFISSSQPNSSVLDKHPEVNYITDIAEKEKVIKIYKRQEVAVNFINKYSNIVAMVALPLICFIYWLFYRKGRYNYAEHLAACMYMAGLTNLVYAVIFIPVSLLIRPFHSNSSLTILLPFTIFQIIYNSVFYYHFINGKTKTSAGKAFLVSIFAILFWMALSSLLVGMYIRNGWGGLLL